MSSNYDPEKVLHLLDDIHRYVLECPNMRHWDHHVLDHAIAEAMDEQTCYVLRLQGKGHLIGDAPDAKSAQPAADKPVRFLVSWDFTERPISTFYSVLDELITDGGAHYVQKSVYVVRDAELAQLIVGCVSTMGPGTSRPYRSRRGTSTIMPIGNRPR